MKTYEGVIPGVYLNTEQPVDSPKNKLIIFSININGWGKISKAMAQLFRTPRAIAILLQ